MYNKGASGAAIVGVLIIVIILIVVIYGINSGKLNFGKTKSSTPNSFYISASLNATSIYSGHSAPLYLTFFNPFNQPVNLQLQAEVGSPNYVAISPSSKTISMPASMSTPTSVLFNVSCLGSSSSVSSTYLFSSKVTDFWQNFTTSVITYPYGIASSLIPQTIYNNTNQGFMSVTANPISIETQIPSGSLSQNMNLAISPTYDSGEPYTEISSGTPNKVLSNIIITIKNSSGIASASAYYNGQTYPFSVSGKTLKLSLSNVNLALIKPYLTFDIRATNLNSTSQNIVNIDINYNYYFSFPGSPAQISCD